MVRKPKNYKIGNMVYFIFHDLPHTGIIKYIHKDTFEIEDMTFIDIMDKDTAEIPKNDCIKTGEIYLPKYPDNAQRKMVKVFDKKHIEVVFQFDDCYQSLLKQIGRVGCNVSTEDNGRIAIERKEVV